MSRPVISMFKDDKTKAAFWVAKDKETGELFKDKNGNIYLTGRLEMGGVDVKVRGFVNQNKQDVQADSPLRNTGDNYDFFVVAKEKEQTLKTTKLYINPDGSAGLVVGDKNDNPTTIRGMVNVQNPDELLPLMKSKIKDIDKMPLIKFTETETTPGGALWIARNKEGEIARGNKGKAFVSGYLKKGEKETPIVGNLNEKGRSALFLVSEAPKKGEEKTQKDQEVYGVYVNPYGQASLSYFDKTADKHATVTTGRICIPVAQKYENEFEIDSYLKNQTKATEAEAPEDEQIFTPEPDNDTSYAPF